MQIGIDEVGRGSWAGPLVVGATALTQDIPGITDSKKINPLQRTELAEVIQKTAKTGLGWVTAQEIDKLGLTAAITLAIKRSLTTFTLDAFTEIVIDGHYNFLPGVPNVVTKVGADATVLSVGAASILAKVARDRYMHEQALLFPEYGFERHVGYGTRQHRLALVTNGPCEIHRYSYKPVAAAIRPQTRVSIL